MNTDMTQIIRKLVLPLALIVAGGAVLIVAFNYVAQAKLRVSAPSGSEIVVATSSGNTISSAKATSASTTLGVPAGSYTVTVTYGPRQEQFFTASHAFSTTTLTFTNTPLLTAATVARQVAYNAILSGTAVTYLNTTKRAVLNLNQDGTLVALDNNNPVGSITSDNPGTAQSLHPIANHDGVVLSNNTLYGLHNNQLSPLNTTGLPSDITSIVIGSSQTQPSFIVGINQSLYLYTSLSSAPQKIADVSKTFDEVAYGGTKIMVYSTRMPYARENITSAYGKYAIDPILIDTVTKTQQTLTGGPITDASISPDGSYMTTEPQGSGTTTLYNLTRSSALFSFSSPDTATPVWVDSSHVVYGKNSVIWSMDAKVGDATAIATLSAGIDATSLTYASDTGTYYVTTYPDEGTATIYKLTSASADINGELMARIDNPRQNNSQFLLSYVNITRPTVVITTNVVLNNPTVAEFNSATLQSRQAAIAYLQGQHVDTGKLTIVYNPSL